MNKKLLLGMGLSALKEAILSEQEFGSKYARDTANQIGLSMPIGGEIMYPGSGTGLQAVGVRPISGRSDFTPANNKFERLTSTVRPNQNVVPIRTQEVPGVVGGTVAAAGGVVSGVFRGTEADLIDDIVVSPRTLDGGKEVARRNQDRDRQNRRKTSKKLSIYFTISIAALLAAGFTVSQASKLVKKIRTNLRGRKAALDIVKLANMGDTEGAQMLLDREFGKTGIDMNKVAGAVEGVSNRELKVAARVLRKEIQS